MTHTEIWVDIVANVLVCLLCVVTTSILISTWYSLTDEGYPRWTLVAIGLLYLDFAIRRILYSVHNGYPIYTTIVVWDILSIIFTAIGMIGHIAKVHWVRQRIYQYRSDVAKERAIIEDLRIQLLETDSKLKAQETQKILTAANK